MCRPKVSYEWPSRLVIIIEESLTRVSFAWMEMSKTLATIFRLYRFERTTNKPSETREGFFVKVTECTVRIARRELI